MTAKEITIAAQYMELLEEKEELQRQLNILTADYIHWKGRAHLAEAAHNRRVEEMEGLRQNLLKLRRIITRDGDLHKMQSIIEDSIRCDHIYDTSISGNAKCCKCGDWK